MELRKTGIDIIGDVPWGTHISQLYSTKYDFLNLLTPYIKEGLLNNELCLWVYSQKTSYHEIKEFMKHYISNIEEFVSSGKFIIMPYTEWYLKDNSFNEVRTNEQWRSFVKLALDHGFDGLRAVADTGWLEKSYFRSFSIYEHNADKIISELPFLAVCIYDINKIDLSDFAEIINNHSYTVIKEYGEYKILRNVELMIKNKQLEKSIEDYRKLLQLLPDAVFIHDKQKILYCNDAAAHMVGMDNPSEIIGKSMAELIEKNNRQYYSNFIERILSGKVGSDFINSKLVDLNENIIDIQVVASSYLYNGFPTVLSVVRNVSHINKINELEKNIKKNTELLNETLEYDKLRTEFLANISHEFRTPLNVILSALQLINLLDDYSIRGKLKKYLNMIKQNCYRLLRLVNNLIDITKIDSGFFQLNFKNYNIVEVVEDITQSVSDYVESKGIELQFDTNTEEKIVACDADQIERIILNLLSNAVKFTPPGGNVWVDVFDLSDKVEIRVKDNGIGIPQDKQESIFDRFQQVDKSLTREHEGSGIGLSLVKLLVKKHGGKITVKSKVGAGTEFIIEIPCSVLDETKIEDTKTYFLEHNCVEIANIEFSDIYS